jgi:hypothetical protein
MNFADNLPPQLDNFRLRALAVGVLALALCLFGAWRDPLQFFRSYLLGYLFWIGFPLGCTALVMLHHLTGGAWGFLIRRLLESGTRTFLLMAVLFLPLVAGISRLYIWAQPAAVAADPMLQYKHLYLNTPFFLVRAAFYFAVWIGLAFFLNKWSADQDRTGEPGPAGRLEALSAPGLILFGLTATFAAIDWVMSLEPHWFSTVYGLLFMVIEVLSALALSTLMARLLAGREPLARLASPSNFHDLGNLILAFVMLWAYLSLAQFLIIWMGNLKEEIPWYTSRTAGGWSALAIFLIVFHFAVPFLLLLARGVKRRAQVIAPIAAALMLMGLVDIFWLLVPAFGSEGIRVHWMDIAAPVGIGGVWMAAFLSQLKNRSLVPLHDPRLEGVPAHAE